MNSGWPSGRWMLACPVSGSRAKEASEPWTDAATADHGCPSIAARSIPTIPANASFARTTTSSSSSSTKPSTAASNTSRRCSSERRIVSFVSRTRSRARSASRSAVSRLVSASSTVWWACVLATWFATTRAAMPPPRRTISSVDWSDPIAFESPRTATLASAPQAVTIDTLLRIGRASRSFVLGTGTPWGTKVRTAASNRGLRT